MAGTANSGKTAGLLSKLTSLFSSGGGKTALGLSIGTSSVKLVELTKSRGGWELTYFGMVPLPEDTIVNREVANSVAIVDALQSLVAQRKLKGRPVCTGLSGPAIIIKRMTVEVQDQKELQDAVFWEAEQYLPFDPSEVAMDFHVISRAKDAATDVIFVAAKISIMDGYLAAIEDASLKPGLVDSEFFSLQNVYEANYPANPQEAVAVVDVGASAIKVVVVHGGVPVYTKDATIGGRTLTNEIQKNLNLSYADAEALKIGNAGGLPQEVIDLMSVVAENFGVEVKRALDFYNASSSGAPVSYILLTGGSALIPDLSRIIEEKTGLPTQLLNPFSNVTYDESMFTPEQIQLIAPFACVPIGLAIRAGAG